MLHVLDGVVEFASGEIADGPPLKETRRGVEGADNRKCLLHRLLSAQISSIRDGHGFGRVPCILSSIVQGKTEAAMCFVELCWN